MMNRKDTVAEYDTSLPWQESLSADLDRSCTMCYTSVDIFALSSLHAEWYAVMGGGGGGGLSFEAEVLVLPPPPPFILEVGRKRGGGA